MLTKYGPPDQLELTTTAVPVPAAGEVLVRVLATSVNPYDWHLMRGEPRVARLMTGEMGLRRPRITVPGCDIAGQVEQAGAGVTGFRPGDAVIALARQGGFAHYAAVPAGALARAPRSLTPAQAAALPMAGVTALLAVRDAGRLKAGQAVLVNGASGGVGTFAVQVARALGADVTGVCSAASLDLVRGIGAGHAVDYAAADVTRAGRRYDLVVDIAGTHLPAAWRRALRPDGTLVVVGGPQGRWLQPAAHVFGALALGRLTGRRVSLADTTGAGAPYERLHQLADMAQAGALCPVIGRRYRFADLPEALRYQEQGHARGKVVVETACS